MSTSIDNLLTQYDTGKLSRRGLLAAIALIAVPRPARAQRGSGSATETTTYKDLR